MSGKGLIKKKEHNRLIIGRKRLIRGLEMALLRCKKNEKFTLVIAPEFAYGNSDHFEVVTPNSTLIY